MFLLVGLQIKIQAGFELALTYCPHTITNLPSQHVVSEGFFIAALAARYSQSVSSTIAKSLRAVTQRLIVNIATPYPSKTVVTERQPDWTPFGSDGAGDVMAALSRRATALALPEIDAVLTQPSETVTHGAFTQPAFLGGPRLMSGEQRSKDDERRVRSPGPRTCTRDPLKAATPHLQSPVPN